MDSEFLRRRLWLAIFVTAVYVFPRCMEPCLCNELAAKLPSSRLVTDGNTRPTGCSGIRCGQSAAPREQLSGRIRVFDLGNVSARGVGGSETNKFVVGIAIGSNIRLSSRSLRKQVLNSDVADIWRLYCDLLAQEIFKEFESKATCEGQAIMTLDVKRDGSIEVPTRNIFVPGLVTSSGSYPMARPVEQFWRAVEVTLSKVRRSPRVRFPANPEIESVTFEVSLGVDRALFPRHKVFGHYADYRARKGEQADINCFPEIQHGMVIVEGPGDTAPQSWVSLHR